MPESRPEYVVCSGTRNRQTRRRDATVVESIREPCAARVPARSRFRRGPDRRVVELGRRRERVVPIPRNGNHDREARGCGDGGGHRPDSAPQTTLKAPVRVVVPCPPYRNGTVPRTRKT